MTDSATGPPAAEVRPGVLAALREGWADLKRAWTLRATGMSLLWVAAGTMPFLYGGAYFERSTGLILYFALAVMGLNMVMGLANVPSIGHGAFVALGALVTALLQSKASWPIEPALLTSVGVTCLAAVIVGIGVIRLRPVAAAISSWIGAWLVVVTLQSFPVVSGGAEGIVLDEGLLHVGFSGPAVRMTPLFHLELGLVLLGLAVLVCRSLSTGAVGLSLATSRQNPRAASSIGAGNGRLRLGIFVIGAAIAGLAGALAVQLSGIFDPAAYSILLSISLFIAVLVGGPGTTLGPLVAAAIVALLPLSGRPLVHLFDLSGGITNLLPGPLLLAAVWIRSRRTADRGPVSTPGRGEFISPSKRVTLGAPEDLHATRLAKRFEGVRALADVEVRARPGTIHGVMGPNGSGKSTLLQILAGHLAPDDGWVLLGDRDITTLGLGDRIRLGIGHSPQGIEVFPDLSARDHMLAALLHERRHAGLFRSLFRTPLNRAEEARYGRIADELVARLGLTRIATMPVRSISVGDQRILMVGMAAAHRRVVLLDEPTAGVGIQETRRIAALLEALKLEGATLLVVEHNLRLLGRSADTITVLDGGEVIAQDTPQAIYSHPEVREAYMGTS